MKHLRLEMGTMKEKEKDHIMKITDSVRKEAYFFLSLLFNVVLYVKYDY